jgi:hypothetical protein
MLAIDAGVHGEWETVVRAVLGVWVGQPCRGEAVFLQSGAAQVEKAG